MTMGYKFVLLFFFFISSVVMGFIQQNKEWLVLGIGGLTVIYGFRFMFARRAVQE